MISFWSWGNFIGGRSTIAFSVRPTSTSLDVYQVERFEISTILFFLNTILVSLFETIWGSFLKLFSPKKISFMLVLSSNNVSQSTKFFFNDIFPRFGKHLNRTSIFSILFSSATIVKTWDSLLLYFSKKSRDFSSRELKSKVELLVVMHSVRTFSIRFFSSRSSRSYATSSKSMTRTF